MDNQTLITFAYNGILTILPVVISRTARHDLIPTLASKWKGAVWERRRFYVTGTIFLI